MNRSGKPHALLSTARVANVPSVVSNVILGIVLGILQSDSGAVVIALDRVAMLLVASVLLYVGGNFLNDWADRKWDGSHRPERALPRGLFSARTYLTIAIAAGLIGTALATLAGFRSGIVAAAIVGCIVLYTFFHKRSAWAVIPMGLCRALLPVMGSMMFFPYLDGIWPVSLALLCYIMGLSLSARYESLATPPKRIGMLARALLLAAAVFVTLGLRDFYPDRWSVLAGALPYLLWTSYCLRYRRQPVPMLVSGLLAGIPLVDWMALLPLALSVTGVLSLDPLGIVCFIIPPMAFISALLLQKLAPAT